MIINYFKCDTIVWNKLLRHEKSAAFCAQSIVKEVNY